MDYSEGKATFETKMGHLRGLYDAYQAAMENGEVGEEELDLLNNTTNNLQHDVDTLRRLLDAHQKTEKKTGVKDKGEGKKSKKPRSHSAAPGKVTKSRKKNAKKSTKFVDSDVEDNHPVPATSKRAPSETKTAPSPLAKTSPKEDLYLSDSEGELLVHNTEVFDEEKKKSPSGSSTAAVTNTSDDSVKFIRNPLNCDDSSSDSDDSRLSRKRTRSSSTSRSSSRGSSIKSCSPSRDSSYPVKKSRGRSTSPPAPAPVVPTSQPAGGDLPSSNVIMDSTPNGSSSVPPLAEILPTFKVHIDPNGYWKTHTTKLISNLPEKSELFDIKKLAKPRLRICSYYQWSCCNHKDKAYHDDKSNIRWFHGCTYCHRISRTIQSHPLQECPFIKLDFVQT